VHEFLQARDEKRLLRLQMQLARYRLLVIDELGYVPLSPAAAELLFEVSSQRYPRDSTFVTSNLPLEEWTSTFGSKRLTHHVQILEMNGGGFRLKHSRQSIKARTPNTAPRFVHSPAQLRCSMGARRSAGL
jgi:DNA replication protein DnaC